MFSRIVGIIMYIQKEYDLEEKEETAPENIGKYCYQTVVEKFGITSRQVENNILSFNSYLKEMADIQLRNTDMQYYMIKTAEIFAVDAWNSSVITSVRTWSSSKHGQSLTKFGTAFYHLAAGTMYAISSFLAYAAPELPITKPVGLWAASKVGYHYARYFLNFNEAFNTLFEED